MQTYGLSRSHVYRALREHGALRPWVDRKGQSKKIRYPGQDKRRRKKASPQIADETEHGRPSDGQAEKEASLVNRRSGLTQTARSGRAGRGYWRSICVDEAQS